MKTEKITKIIRSTDGKHNVMVIPLAHPKLPQGKISVVEFDNLKLVVLDDCRTQRVIRATTQF